MKNRMVILLFLLVAQTNITAQSMINCMGGGTVYNGLIFEANIGEMSAVSTFSANGIALTQGILQKYEVNVLSVEPVGMKLDLSLYPNPSSDILNLYCTGISNSDVNIQILDQLGKVVLSTTKKLNTKDAIHTFDVRNIASGTYLLNISVCDRNDIVTKYRFKFVKL